ncbi:MAG: FimV/HubP family polar landmark protein [Motiliproteus sp.]
MLRKSAISLAVISALGAMQAHALGLGEVTVTSALNEPLEAEIDLLQLRDLNASQVITSLANTDDFYLAGVRPSPILSDIRFKLDIKGGRGKVILTTRSPIREPFLNFLIEVNWPSGRLVREYTVLLDPPVFTTRDLTPQRQPVAPVAQLAASVPSKRPGKTASRSKSSAAVLGVAAGSSQHSVTKEDTLWGIALKTRPDKSVSPQQMMLAILRANPDAFIKNNINRLKSGVVLEIPSKEQIQDFNTQESLQEVRRQNSSWKDMPDAGASTKAAKLDATKTEIEAGSAAAVEDDQLRIVSKVAEETAVSPIKDGTVSTEISAVDAQASPRAAEIAAQNEELEEQLVVTLEGLNKVERDNVEMSGQLEQLTEQMGSMQQLIELKDQQLAGLQQQLAKQQEEAAAEQGSGIAWIAGAAAGVLALLAGLFLFMRKRKEDREVDEALEFLDRRDLVVEEPAATEEPSSAAAVVADEVGDAALADAFVEENSEDPFNTSTESHGLDDEFDSISDDELDSALGDDLDMDLKLDEPVIDDPEMAAFSNSLLDDDEFDLSTGFDEESVDTAAIEADADLGADLDALLAGSDLEGSETGGLNAETNAAGSELANLETDTDLGFDGDLDALLAENDLEGPEADELNAETAAADSELADFEADTDLEFDGDLDALLAESDLEGSETDELNAEADVADSELAELEADSDLEFDGDLDALLAESEFAEGESESEQGAVGLGSEGFDAAVDTDRAEASQVVLDDEFGSELDDLLVEQGSQDLLLEGEESMDETLEQLLEDHDKHAASTGIERVALAVDDDDIPDDEALGALLGKAESQGIELESDASGIDAGIDEGIDIEFEAIEDLAEDEAPSASTRGEMQLGDLEVGELPGQVLAFDTAEKESLEFELDAELLTSAELAGLNLDDDVDGGLDDLPQKFELDLGTDVQKRSSLSLEDELDQADNAELEAELEQMLVSEDNALALQETDLDDEEVNYLDEADEVGTKIDLARAYIDMDDYEGARDILREVVAEGSSEQVAEAEKLLESLNS